MGDGSNQPATVRKIGVSCLRYSLEEYGRIRKGFTVRDMDDKWALVWTDGVLEICRSWTGEVIWRCKFEEGASGVDLTEIWVSDAVPARHELEDIGAAWFLIGWRILGSVGWEDVDEIQTIRREPDGPIEVFGDWARLLRRRLGPDAGPLPELPARLEEQLTYFLRMHERVPRSVGVQWRLASVYRALHRQEEAEDFLSRLVGGARSSSPTVWALTERAWLRSESGRGREAAEDLAEAVRQSSEASALSDLRARIKARLHERERQGNAAMGALARRDLLDEWEAIRSAPLPGFDARARGLLRFWVEDWQGAMGELGESILLDPGDAITATYWALALLQAGDIESARAATEVVAQLDPLGPITEFLKASVRA